MPQSLNLDAKATQNGFAELVGVSQQAVSQRVADGQLPRGATYRRWLHLYCEQLRREAAGRSGDDQAALSKARTKQALADANMKELQYYRELKLLVPAAEIEPALQDWAAMARSETQFAVDKFVAALQSQHGIEVDQALIDGTFTPAFRAIGSYPTQLAGDADEGGEGMDTAAAAPDAGVAG
jgi:hypothetical protein